MSIVTEQSISEHDHREPPSSATSISGGHVCKAKRFVPNRHSYVARG
ncbi:hypothetical protein KPL74_05665 [Bacillus sp. NP157]|nr:hypothetical protein KPL74_05665 [Bacillus sp. NP157]